MRLIIKYATLVLAGLIYYFIASAVFSPFASANVRVQNDVIICPALTSSASLPDFSSSECELKSFSDIKPINKQIWIKATLVVPQGLLEEDQPLGIFIYGKASSLVYLNGNLIGRNGSPSITKDSEVPGKMDAVVFAPNRLLKHGANEIVLKMSGHGGFLDLKSPMHWVGLGSYIRPSDMKLRYYWKSLLPLGILILGVIYFGVAALRQKAHWLLPLMSLSATGQLCAEVARGLTAYSYPMHDLRLVMILLFSLSFGLAILAYTFSILRPKGRAYLFVIGSILTIVVTIVVEGFDIKSTLSIGLPIAMSLCLALYSSYKKQAQAIELALSLSFFCIVVALAPASFLDVYFFYVVAGLLILLFVQQISVFAKETQVRIEEKERGDKLQLIIDQNRHNQQALTLRVNHTNKAELIDVSDIVYCKGAGDYVELALTNGSTLLHSDNMANLEVSLPSIFLRVHRSYIVNTSLIKSLERKKSGVGVLILKGGKTVPVSRRIMPSVREHFD